MGSGNFAAEGLLKAAYVRNPRYYDPFWFGVEPPDGVPNDITNKPLCYNRTQLGPGTTPGDIIFFLGGPGGKVPGCVWP
jgi:hypothetical protein